jgi:A/G-specific adenine glycosylase
MSIQPKSDNLLFWYDKNGRELPWRYKSGKTPDPYIVWLSEIMLQQTTITVVKDYFNRFLIKWPTLLELSRAKLDDVLLEWAGLGYYARARNLHKCAQIICEKYDGKFPESEDELISLPGIGTYTAAAITSIAFDNRAVVIDGNVERVISRVFAITQPLPISKKLIRQKADKLTPNFRSGDYAQAIMDLGSTICSPKSPACFKCPWEVNCEGKRMGLAEDLPRKLSPKSKPSRKGICFWITRNDGYVLMRRREEKGLLGGMMEIPSTPWEKNIQKIEKAVFYSPIKLPLSSWVILPGEVKQIFTHFNLYLLIGKTRITENKYKKLHLSDDFIWVHPEKFDKQALPSLMKKVINYTLFFSGS